MVGTYKNTHVRLRRISSTVKTQFLLGFFGDLPFKPCLKKCVSLSCKVILFIKNFNSSVD